MKLHDNVITLETFTEVHKVFYAPVDYDEAEGTNPGEHAGRIFVDCSNNYIVKHARPSLTGYHGRLGGSVNKRKLANFNFNEGVEESYSWWGVDSNCISREDSTSDVKAYLKAAKTIAQAGFSEFEFTFYDDESAYTRSIDILHVGTGATLTISDIIDPNMYADLTQWVDEKTQELSDYKVEESVDVFVNTIRKNF